MKSVRARIAVRHGALVGFCAASILDFDWHQGCPCFGQATMTLQGAPLARVP